MLAKFRAIRPYAFIGLVGIGVYVFATNSDSAGVKSIEIGVGCLAILVQIYFIVRGFRSQPKHDDRG